VNDLPTIDLIRRHFADAIAKSDFVPRTAKISIRDELELGDAAVIHCKWPLVERAPNSGNYSREITVQISASEMNRFRSAEPRMRGDMMAQFSSIFYKRLLDGQYNEQDASPPAFMIKIDEYSLDP
jgi:hypothetical protein